MRIEWSELTTYEEAKVWCQGRYPVLVRPSYVLSGGGMAVIRDEAGLQEYLEVNSSVSRDFLVVVSKVNRNSCLSLFKNQGEKSHHVRRITTFIWKMFFVKLCENLLEFHISI